MVQGILNKWRLGVLLPSGKGWLKDVAILSIRVFLSIHNERKFQSPWKRSQDYSRCDLWLVLFVTNFQL